MTTQELKKSKEDEIRLVICNIDKLKNEIPQNGSIAALEATLRLANLHLVLHKITKEYFDRRK